ncbi:MAG TPA: efflux RND transporter permease subunit [Longimicrobiaceae bacterium]|nr:efflux RND transporter permease subunit [Longimicrobiaceae bacterium]
MWISDFAIRRPIVTVVTMLALVVFGVFALANLKTDEFPDVQQPIVGVSIIYPGASPDGVEREVVDPIEEAIAGISGVDKMQSVSQDGFAQLIVFFDFEKDLQQATQDIRDKISTIRGDLPAEMEEPILTRFDPADLPVVSLTLSSSTLGPPELTALADPGITKQLRSISGVAQVSVVGGVEREMTVQVRPEALQAAGISVAQVVQALQTQNLAAPVGRITGALEERSIRLKGRLETPQDFASLVVAQRGDRLVRLGEVADVRAGSQEPRSLALFNGQQAIGINVLKSKGYSTTDVADQLLARVAEVQKTLPAGTRLQVVQNAGERVRDSVHNVQRSLFEGALLTVLVVFLFLNSWRSTVITGLALPVSVLAAFVAVWAFGFTLNSMSLLGLSLAIGILIDDAIVVRENIVRHIEMGKDHFTASREGTAEIGLAVAATTFSIVSVFIPIGFMYGVAGQWFKPFALTIASAVLVSLFVSFSLDPMLSAYWADPQTESHERGNPIARALERFNRWFDRQAENYKKVIAWALDHRLAMVAIAVASFFGAIALQVVAGGSGFVPDSDRGEINVTIETPPGSSLEYTRLKAEEAARVARAHPEVAYTYATVGGSSTIDGGASVDQGNIYVRLTPKSERDVSQSELGEVIRQELTRIGGATYSVFTSGFGGNYKQIQIEMRGPDAATLTRLATQFASEVRRVPGAVDVTLSSKGQRPELSIEMNRGLAASMGLSVGQIAQSLYPAFAGIDAGDWVDPTGETRDVNVRLAPEARARAADLHQLPITVIGADGQPATLPLGQVATIRRELGPAQINHLDQDRVVNVQANVAGRSLGQVMTDINARIAAMDLPPGYRITQGGEAADQAEVFGRIFTALGIAVMLMYLILVMQFGSFLDPIAIMLSLPLSLIGVVLALMITGDTLNIMSMIGVILLMGIVAKNAILLIDFAKWGREQGMGRREALIEAGRVRLRPILMTTFALVAGMVPVALGTGSGGDFYAPLGRAVIGGVITSTFLTLLVIPTFYEILDEWKEWLLHRFFRRGGTHAAHAPPAPHGVSPMTPALDPGD